MSDERADSNTEVAMPVSDLHGRTVWTDGGERIGTIRDVNSDDAGKIVSLNVRERWILGKLHEVPASGMRMDEGDVVVPDAALASVRTREATAARGDHLITKRLPTHTGMPVLLVGREGARLRFGGLDLLGSFFGALVTFASVVLIGGFLATAFGSGEVNIDTSAGSFGDITSQELLVGAATLLSSCFLGGWAAGRSSRFDGIGNGLMTVAWVLGIGVVLGGLGAWWGDKYDVYANTDIPRFVTGDFSLWGSVAFAAALVLMLLGAALGGALGESWHRRADRAMLGVVNVDDGAAAPGRVGSPVAPQPQVVDDSDALDIDSADRRPRT